MGLLDENNEEYRKQRVVADTIRRLPPVCRPTTGARRDRWKEALVVSFPKDLAAGGNGWRRLNRTVKIKRRGVRYVFAVPAYEVISPHSIGKRDADGALHRVRLKAFGERHELQLEPSNGLLAGDKLRAWTAHHNATTDTVHYTELPHDVSVWNSFAVSPTGRSPRLSQKLRSVRGTIFAPSRAAFFFFFTMRRGKKF